MIDICNHICNSFIEIRFFFLWDKNEKKLIFKTLVNGFMIKRKLLIKLKNRRDYCNLAISF